MKRKSPPPEHKEKARPILHPNLVKLLCDNETSHAVVELQLLNACYAFRSRSSDPDLFVKTFAELVKQVRLLSNHDGSKTFNGDRIRGLILSVLAIVSEHMDNDEWAIAEEEIESLDDLMVELCDSISIIFQEEGESILLRIHGMIRAIFNRSLDSTLYWEELVDNYSVGGCFFEAKKKRTMVIVTTFVDDYKCRPGEPPSETDEETFDTLEEAIDFAWTQILCYSPSCDLDESPEVRRGSWEYTPRDSSKNIKCVKQFVKKYFKGEYVPYRLDIRFVYMDEEAEE